MFRKKRIPEEKESLFFIILNFGNGKTKTLDDVDAESIKHFTLHKGDQFQYNGIVYDVTDVRLHLKEGFKPYMEFFLKEVPEM